MQRCISKVLNSYAEGVPLATALAEAAVSWRDWRTALADPDTQQAFDRARPLHAEAAVSRLHALALAMAEGAEDAPTVGAYKALADTITWVAERADPQAFGAKPSNQLAITITTNLHASGDHDRAHDLVLTATVPHQREATLPQPIDAAAEFLPAPTVPHSDEGAGASGEGAGALDVVAAATPTPQGRGTPPLGSHPTRGTVAGTRSHSTKPRKRPKAVTPNAS